MRMDGAPGDRHGPVRPNGTPQPVMLKPTQGLQLPGALNRCYLGLSWQSGRGRRELDLDASAALFSGGKCINVISFQQLRDNPRPPFTVVHTGDIMTGGGSMKSSVQPSRDLERIYFDLFKLTPQVDTIVLLVNCFTESASFADLQRATCRIVNADSEQELGRFELANLRGNGLVFGQLMRAAPASRQWQFLALGMSRPARTAQELVMQVASGARPPQAHSAPHKKNQVMPASDATVAKKPTASRVSPGLIAATVVGTAAGAAVFTAVALDTGMLGGEGGGVLAGAMANMGDISMPEMPFDVDLAPITEAMSDLGDLAGDAVGNAGEIVGDLGSSLQSGFGDMGGIDAVSGYASNAAGAVGGFASGAAEWGGDNFGDVFQNAGGMIGNAAGAAV